MSVLKEKILQSAIRLFAEKGYQATSIQDIADDCSIAKGSLYKHFGSKEELYISILEKRQQDMIDAVDRIQKMQLPKRETYLEELACQFDFYIEHGYYISRDHNELPPVNNDKIENVLSSMRKSMFLYYQDILTRQYGQAIEHWKWDAAAMLSGLIREYTFHLLFGYMPIDKKELALFIAERMDDLVEGLRKRSGPPLLTDELMAEYAQIDLKGVYASREGRREALIHKISSIIPDIAVPNQRKQELAEVTAMLQEESGQEQPRRFLQLALLRDLQSESELSFYANQLLPLI
ncbi:TetR family transcriptional regulator [Paenibacillus macerans]|uniref:TetR family transcriptional regulator n=1 Tax=Paenibacillus macerans TaxID=44252 RepID=A0A6N8EWW4_PAEMA|nr:TetR/AcrR family transcriptional regulator [Paenibacillus macerans]MUG23280.1 TetR family transcriptional regulator [Paenibacillus macerans]UMV45987.1 TetR/AcrR family transcriptional regulator [Paenibacillus macerans]